MGLLYLGFERIMSEKSDLTPIFDCLALFFFKIVMKPN